MDGLSDELRALFFEDALRHLGGAAALLGGAAGGAPHLPELRRHAHSLKGLGAAVGDSYLREVASGLERLVAAAEGRQVPLADQGPLIHEALGALANAVEALRRDGAQDPRSAAGLLRRLTEARRRLEA